MTKPLMPRHETVGEINARLEAERAAEANGADDYDELMDALNAPLAEPMLPPPTKLRQWTKPVVKEGEPEEAPDETESKGADTDVDPDLIENNLLFAVVKINGKPRVISREANPIYPGCKTIIFWTFHDFRAYHDKKRKTIEGPDGKSKQIGMGTWWINHPDRRQFDGIIFDPDAGETEGNHLNLWQGFGVEPVQGDWSLYCAHLLHNVCCGDEDHFEYLLDWMAYSVQSPGLQCEVALVLRGTEGVGKGVLAKYFGVLFGPHYLHIWQPGHLTGHFNAHLQQCALLFADEAFFAGDRRDENQLKALVTERTMLCEPKGLDAYTIKNCLTIIMSSNNDWVVPASADARRYFVLDVSAEHKQDHDYFAGIAEQMENGGCAALLYDLSIRDLSDFNLRKVPQTDALADQKTRSRRGVDRLIEIIARQGVLPAAHLYKLHIAITSGEEDGNGFYPAARRLVPDLKHQSSIVVGNSLKKDWGCKPWKSGERGISFPPLAKLRTKFDDRHGPQDWPEMSDWGDTEETVEEDRENS